MRALVLACLTLAAFAQSPGPAIVVGADAGAGGLTPPATITQSATGVTALTGVSLDGATTPFWAFDNNNAADNFGSSGGGVLRFNSGLALANSPSATGTLIGGNMPSGFTGNIFDWSVNGSGVFRVTNSQTQISNLAVMNTTFGVNALVATGANNGRISTYNADATGQATSNGTMGVPYFRAGAQVASASNTALTTIITPVASAMYRVAFYCFVSTTDAARTATVVINWSDPNGNAQTVNACNAVSTAAAGTFVAGQQVIATNTTAVQYSITYTGGATGVLTLKYTMERLQ